MGWAVEDSVSKAEKQYKISTLHSQSWQGILEVVKKACITKLLCEHKRFGNQCIQGVS